MEIDTAVRHGAKIAIIVSNNAVWNIERLDQEANYGGRLGNTQLAHSDYAAMACAFGAHGERVEKPDDLPGTMERALANAPATVDVVTSQTVVSSDATTRLGFVPAFQTPTPWDDFERKGKIDRRADRGPPDMRARRCGHRADEGERIGLAANRRPVTTSRSSPSPAHSR
jgi:hypothetical protein